ncbi:MAG: hypothetical protein ACYDBB_24200 [Armatimonadota bacterium]
MMISGLPTHILAFIQQQRCPGPSGRYRYSAASREATLYAACYAIMARHLLGELDSLPSPERAAWIAYLTGHQDDDGLFRDPVIYDRGWYAGDPLWCGRPHLTCHVVAALACLGGVAAKPLRGLDPWRDPDRLVRWLEARDWGAGVAWTGNEIMNVGVLLQYARDFQGDDRAGRAVAALLAWLSTHHVDPATGVWGAVDVADPVWRSHAVQAAYHWWPLFFYDGAPIPFIEQAVDTVLATQNPLGGFGWGVHNAAEPYLSSACEDIDSIDPLCRMLHLTDYRRDDIRAALTRAAEWVLTNQMPDGGFVFLRDVPFEYGHPALHGAAGQGAMFPTWFRLLSLALIGKALPNHPLGQIPWQFVRCPGMQFGGSALYNL